MKEDQLDLMEAHKNQMKENKDKGSSNELYALSWLLTPQGAEDLKEGFSLHQLAIEANKNLGRFLREKDDEYQINVIFTDFLRDARVTDCAIMLNRRFS